MFRLMLTGTPLLGAATLALMLAAVPASAKTADGVTPSSETMCDLMEGRQRGLCNAYCEAMDCDGEEPRANDRACEQVFDTWISLLPPEAELPPCDDVDLDGWDNDNDNCPGIANDDQLDTNQDGVGDACDEE